MPKQESRKVEPVVLPVVVTEGDKPVGGGVFLGEATTVEGADHCELEGFAFVEVPNRDNLREAVESEMGDINETRNPGDSAKNSTSYGYSPEYGIGYDKIDWGKVPKN